MKKLFTTLALACATVFSFAQQAGKISGKIVDGGNQKILDAATISLLNLSDSSLAKTSIVDKQGNFIFENVKEGTYIALAQSVGHVKVYSEPVTVDAEHLQLNIGTLKLQTISKEMAAVVVTASSRKQFVERQIDKMVVNPDALISNTGTSALEVLEKSPGVMVDKDGNISLRGKQGVIVMLDGKQTYMSSADLANYLKGMPSSSIDQIEIMTNPSAKYDAAGNSGIINIRTKKTKQVGFNGSATLAFGQGIYSKTNNSLNLNYRKNKVNLFGSFSGNYREDYQQLDIKRTYKNDDGSVKAIFEQSSVQKKYRNYYSAKAGLDYYLDKKTTLGVVLNAGISPNIDKNMNTSFLKSNQNQLDSIATARGREEEHWRNMGINLNLRKTLDSAGSEITADIDVINYHTDKDQSLVNSIFNADWDKRYSDQLVGDLPSDINIYSLKTDYSHPLSKTLKMEAGLKASYVTTDNTAGYFNVVNGTSLIDYDKTNQFTYKENVNAAYVNFRKEHKKWGFQTGLRLENTNYEGLQFGNPTQKDSAFKRSYTSAFPTAYMSYKLSDKNSFGLSYGRRINRPGYADLNPFLYFIDKYTYGAGNPFLKPMFSNTFELSHSFHNWLNTSLNYSLTKNLFNETFQQDGYATIVRQDNYGRRDNVSLALNGQLKPSKWWNLMVYTEGRYERFQGLISGEELDVDAYTYMFNVNNQFTFKKGWSAELSGFYRSKGVEGQILINPLGQMSAGVQKQIWKQKGTIKLAVRDIFRTMQPNGNINFQNTEAYFKNSRDSRVATLSFSYRFGKPIKGLKTRRSGGASEEQNRIKGAN